MKVILDVDGVLADFRSAAYEVFEVLTGKTFIDAHNVDYKIEKLLPVDLREAYKDHCACEGFCAGIQPTRGAVAFVRELRRRGHKIIIATAPWSGNPHWISERTAWLDKHFGIPSEDVNHVKDKTGISGDVFLDDKREHIVAWRYANPFGSAYLFDAPYNRNENELPIVSSWADFLERARL